MHEAQRLPIVVGLLRGVRSKADNLKELTHLVFVDEFLQHHPLLQRRVFHAIQNAAVEQKPPLAGVAKNVQPSILSGQCDACEVDVRGDVFLTNQAAYLLDAGIGDIALEIGDPSDPKTFLPISNSLQKLLSEAEMGELFKAFAFSKNLKNLLPEHSLEDLPGFRGRNRL